MLTFLMLLVVVFLSVLSLLFIIGVALLLLTMVAALIFPIWLNRVIGESDAQINRTF